MKYLYLFYYYFLFKIFRSKKRQVINEIKQEPQIIQVEEDKKQQQQEQQQVQKKIHQENNISYQEKLDQIALKNVTLPISAAKENNPDILKSLIVAELRKLNDLKYEYEGIQLVQQRQQEQIQQLQKQIDNSEIQNLQKELTQKKSEQRQSFNKQKQQASQMEKIEYDILKGKRNLGEQVLKQFKKQAQQDQHNKKISQYKYKIYNSITLDSLYKVYDANFQNTNKDIYQDLKQQQQKVQQNVQQTQQDEQNRFAYVKQIQQLQLKVQNQTQNIKNASKDVQQKDIKFLQRLNTIVEQNVKRNQLKLQLSQSIKIDKKQQKTTNLADSQGNNDNNQLQQQFQQELLDNQQYTDQKEQVIQELQQQDLQ